MLHDAIDVGGLHNWIQEELDQVNRGKTNQVKVVIRYRKELMAKRLNDEIKHARSGMRPTDLLDSLIQLNISRNSWTKWNN